MNSLSRIMAVFQARNREFLRDRGTLAWNIILPCILIFGLSMALGGEGRSQYTVGVLQDSDRIDEDQHPFLNTRFIDFVALDDESAGLRQVEHHQLDLLVSFEKPMRYWVNPDSPRGYFAERLLMQSAAGNGESFARQPLSGRPVGYVDWVLPGILGMNMMFSCLFGVGYVVVRYRKNGFLKRLRATPLRPAEFIVAQIASRLLLILTITVFVYLGTHWILGTMMEGQYSTLFLIALIGGISLVAMSLLVSARVTSEELAGGLLNMISWPMMILSGVWFSLENAGPVLQSVAGLLPLTHILGAARAVMLDGASLMDVVPELLVLLTMTIAFLSLGAYLFRWTPRQ